LSADNPPHSHGRAHNLPSRVATGDPARGIAAARDYFASDSRRTIQTTIGLLWLLDGGLQFQSFMYSNGFLRTLTGMEAGQPDWLSASIAWGARFAQADLGVWNTLFALTQVAIGLGILYRPTVRLALASSVAWALVVWWFGEAFGMLFANAASPLTGAPGAVLLYAVIGLIVWPNDRPGGLLGIRGARVAWAGLWCVAAWAWLLAANSSANATRDAIGSAPSGMSWLSTAQQHAAGTAAGNGELIAIVFAATSLAVGIAVAADWQPRTFLWLAVYLNLIYWLFGQGLGGLATGRATDPNAGPLFIVLAAALMTQLRAARPHESGRPSGSTQASSSSHRGA
jgi:hypothetical protein